MAILIKGKIKITIKRPISLLPKSLFKIMLPIPADVDAEFLEGFDGGAVGGGFSESEYGGA